MRCIKIFHNIQLIEMKMRENFQSKLEIRANFYRLFASCGKYYTICSKFRRWSSIYIRSKSKFYSIFTLVHVSMIALDQLKTFSTQEKLFVFFITPNTGATIAITLDCWNLFCICIYNWSKIWIFCLNFTEYPSNRAV